MVKTDVVTEIKNEIKNLADAIDALKYALEMVRDYQKNKNPSYIRKAAFAAMKAAWLTNEFDFMYWVNEVKICAPKPSLCISVNEDGEVTQHFDDDVTVLDAIHTMLDRIIMKLELNITELKRAVEGEDDESEI